MEISDSHCGDPVQKDSAVADRRKPVFQKRRSEYLHGLLAQLNAFRKNNEHCDIQVRVGNHDYNLHKCILAAACPKLHDIVQRQSGIVNLQMLSRLTEGGFEVLVEYFYTGRVSLGIPNLTQALAAAEELDVKDVVEICQDFSDGKITGFDVNFLGSDIDQKGSDQGPLEDLGPGVDDAQGYLNRLALKYLSTKDGVAQPGQSEDTILCSSYSTSPTRRVSMGTQTDSNPPKTEPTMGKHEKKSASNAKQNDLVNTSVPSSAKRRKNQTPKKCKNVVSSPRLASDEEYAISDGYLSETSDSEDERPAKKLKINMKLKQAKVKTKNKTSAKVSRKSSKATSKSITVTKPGTKSSLLKKKEKVPRCKKPLQRCDESSPEKKEKITYPRPCTICGLPMASKRKYFIHIRRHQKERNTCAILSCKEKFDDNENLRVHVQAAHSPLVFKCQHCDMSTIDPHVFRYHVIKEHDDPKPFICPEEGCKYRHTRYCNLKVHMEIHVGMTKFPCTQCGKKYNHKQQLVRHAASCKGLQPHLCDICGKKFMRSMQLKEHKRIHTGERPYLCEYCNQTFRLIGSLKRHMRIHKKIYPYLCPICGRKLRHSHGFKGHMKRLHGLDVAPGGPFHINSTVHPTDDDPPALGRPAQPVQETELSGSKLASLKEEMDSPSSVVKANVSAPMPASYPIGHALTQSLPGQRSPFVYRDVAQHVASSSLELPHSVHNPTANQREQNTGSQPPGLHGDSQAANRSEVLQMHSTAQNQRTPPQFGFRDQLTAFHDFDILEGCNTGTPPNIAPPGALPPAMAAAAAMYARDQYGAVDFARHYHML